MWSHESEAWILFKNISFFKHFLVLFHQTCLKCKKFSHIFRLQGSITPNIDIVGPILDDKMSWSKFSIPSFDCFKLMMTFATLKIYSISIYNPTLPMTWWAKKETWGNCTPWFAHQISGFSISDGHMNNHQYNCNSFCKVDMITSSLDTIYVTGMKTTKITKFFKPRQKQRHV